MTVLYRGLCRQCPHCGQGALFDGWYRQRVTCDHCGLAFEPQDGDTYAFMYLSAALFTGLLIVGMLFAWTRPRTTLFAALFLAAAVVIFMVATLPNRKGIAIALDYLITRRCTIDDHETDEAEGERQSHDVSTHDSA